MSRAVKDAIDAYRDDSDWLAVYLGECCETGEGFEVKSGELYQDYRAWCERCDEYKRSSSDYAVALKKPGFVRKRKSSDVMVVGARVKSEFAL